MNKYFLIGIAAFSILLNSCKKVVPGNDPNFKIIKHKDKGFKATNRKVEVFGIPIYAFWNVEDKKLLHAANLMAQYLDNNEDGIVDDQNVLNAMISNQAALIMWKNKSQIGLVNAPGVGQDLGNGETNPTYVCNGKTGSFDAALEEVLHLISSAGYAKAYPSTFGEYAGTTLSNAMDVARGGQFNDIPGTYPTHAWYTYDDKTCKYNCQNTEYFYWALTSILGAQENRHDEIAHEWKLNTKEKVQQTDELVFNLMTNSSYTLPTILPDGTYKH